jgi:hypothetical protein
VNRNKAGAPLKIRRPSEPSDRQRFAGEGQNGCCAEGDHDLWVHELQFLVQPPQIVLHFARCWFLMNATFATLLKLEVFDGIGDINTLPVDACIGHCPIEQLPGGSDEGPALTVLLVSRLLADQGD